jgi:NADH:ubiquinone oxidoreductase subunit F (NADH-binding)
VAERRDRVQVRAAADGFLAGEESALVSALESRPPLPRGRLAPVRERGLGGRPTLVLNVETLARLARGARGDDDAADGMLVTRRTEVAGLPRVDVADVPLGTPLRDVLPLAGAQALLVGGYAGTWVSPQVAAGLPLDRAGLATVGASPGAGVLAALPADRCGLRETARVTAYLAASSAGQCGPCLNGLPRIAAALDRLARPGTATPALLADVERWCGLLSGRGACSHPDGTVRLVASALRVFAGELAAHAAGTCRAASSVPFLPVPEVTR